MRNQECYKGPKFGFENDEDTFTLIIKKPETADTGRYTCTVRTSRTACWQIRCRGEPPPVFTWVHPVHGELSSNDNFTVMTEEYQGGATTTLVINHAKPEDKGTYTLQAENRNGKEKVDLDLIVLDHLPDCECNL